MLTPSPLLLPNADGVVLLQVSSAALQRAADACGKAMPTAPINDVPLRDALESGAKSTVVSSGAAGAVVSPALSATVMRLDELAAVHRENW